MHGCCAVAAGSPRQRVIIRECGSAHRLPAGRAVLQHRVGMAALARSSRFKMLELTVRLRPCCPLIPQCAALYPRSHAYNRLTSELTTETARSHSGPRRRTPSLVSASPHRDPCHASQECGSSMNVCPKLGCVHCSACKSVSQSTHTLSSSTLCKSRQKPKARMI